MVAQQRLIICSNTWIELLEELSVADRERIDSNSVLVRVDQPLWNSQQRVAPLIMDTQAPHGGAAEHANEAEEVWTGPAELAGPHDVLLEVASLGA